MSNDSKNAPLTKDVLRFLVESMETNLRAPKVETSDQLCEQLAADAQKPNAFRKRLVRRRRQLGMDDGILGGGTGEGSGSGKAAGSTNSPKPKRRKS